MTPRDRNVLRILDATTLATGICPTLAEIAATLGYKSKANVSEALGNLVAEGFIELKDATRLRSRKWRITPLGRTLLGGFQLHDVPSPELHAELIRRAGGSAGVAAHRLAEAGERP